MLDDLLALPAEVARDIYRSLPERDMAALLSAAAEVHGTPFSIWRRDPVGFVEDVLGEATWSKQRAVLMASVEHGRVAVPSGYGVGKTHVAARLVVHNAAVHPPGSALTVTTATRMRQVQRQLWPHIRTVVARAGLPMDADMTQMKMRDSDGVETVVAYGFSAQPTDEAAFQGIHHPNLLLIADEAGGVSRVLGTAMRGLLTGEGTRFLAIGNPPTGDEASWFEGLCDNPKTHTIRIPAVAAPLLSGEVTDWCRTCPPGAGRHRLAVHITDPEWVEDAIRDYGDDSPFVQAKVYAKFPRGVADRVIPSDWVDLAVDNPEPEAPGWVRCDSLPGGSGEWVVQPGAWVRLGVDVAADGGDELVVARMVGDLGTIEHVSSGGVNANAVDVAGRVLEQIRSAALLRAALRTAPPVRVKVDAIGVGWGVASVLEAWRSEGVHDAEIVPVVVSESPGRVDAAAVMRPYRKRDEMWLAGRALLQPSGGPPRVRLRVDDRTKAQLAGPRYVTNSAGYTVVEPKAQMRARGLSSPDRGESWLLSAYEPLVAAKRSGFRVIA
jgi:hypothetical protein